MERLIHGRFFCTAVKLNSSISIQHAELGSDANDRSGVRRFTNILRPVVEGKLKFAISVLSIAIVLAGCSNKPAQQAGAAPQAMPVQTVTVEPQPVARGDEYVSTIKSRRSATITPQVVGNLVKIDVRSGDHVKAGQLLMTIDPLKQQATVDSQKSTEQQKLAVYEYNQVEVERQRKLFAAGVTSRDTLDQAEQAYKNSKADYESAIASRATQENELAYYSIRAPFDGIVGDIPVHLGDYVSSTTLLTTVDENRDLEAYIYVPTERTSEVRLGLPVNIVNTDGTLLESTRINFVAPSVDNGLQGILVKAPLQSGNDKFRTAQLVKARVIWSTDPTPTVPVLAITRIGGQAFVFVAQKGEKGTLAKQRAVTLGDTVGNDYAVLDGLKPGEKVIVSGIQFLVDGAPVQPLG